MTEGDSEKDGVKAIFDKTSGQVAVAAPDGTYFAVRLMGGGSLVPKDSGTNQTSGCKSQAYVALGHADGGVYNFTAAGHSAEGYIAVGYSAAGPPGINTLQVTPVPSTPPAIMVANASAPAFDGP